MGDIKQTYTVPVMAAAIRVSRIFRDGCDRCDIEDLELLENAGLMYRHKLRKHDEFGQDTLQAGETGWFFNESGNALVELIERSEPTDNKE